MKICVTGASGFIGQHVCKALQQAGHLVFGLDAAPSPAFNGAGWITADITLPLERITTLDAVVHLAAVAAPRDCDKNPSRAYDVNVNGTSHVLKMALESGAKKVVFSSSAHVYDIPPRYLPTDEIHPLRLNNTYTTTKILGEQLCGLYWDNHGLSYTTLRLYNAYGPGQALGYFIPDMILKAQTGQIDVRGAGTSKDFVYIDDVARAFALAVGTPFVGAINIGTGVETHLVDVVREIASASGAKVSFSQPNGTLDTRMCADIRRAKRMLDWQPTMNIKEGLRATLDAAKTITVRP